MSTPDRDGGDVPFGLAADFRLEPATYGHFANQPSEEACRWRTAERHDQECERYFDCPSHLLERALSVSEHSDEEEHDEHMEEDMEQDGDEGRPDSGAVSPPSDGGDEESLQRARPPSPALPTAAAAATNPGPGDLQEDRDRPGTGARNPITVHDSSSDSDRPAAEVDSGAPLYPAPAPVPGGSGAAAGPVVRTSTILAPRPGPTVTERPGGSDAQPPRWQPDSDVTYCPICSTQFSIWIRKHHCR